MPQTAKTGGDDWAVAWPRTLMVGRRQGLFQTPPSHPPPPPTTPGGPKIKGWRGKVGPHDWGVTAAFSLVLDVAGGGGKPGAAAGLSCGTHAERECVGTVAVASPSADDGGRPHGLGGGS